MRFAPLAAVLQMSLALNSYPQQLQSGLANNTVLLIRHAEKPEAGTGLTARGERRAALYARYFEPFSEGGLQFNVDALYAGADSEGSYRPRLTLEPLSRASGMPLHLDVGTKDPQSLVRELRTEAHGTHPLIAWRHGQIPALLQAFGADPNGLLPNGKWPDDVYDWVIVLRFNDAGVLTAQNRVQEDLTIPEQ